MSDNLAQTIKLVFGDEGGYSNHPKDPGGATKYGITAATLGSWRKLGRRATPAEVQALTLAEATQILDRQYAQPIRYPELPAGLDYAVFDYAVNSGPAQAAKTLQRILGVDADGVIGAQTLEAIATDSADDLINDLCDARLKFLRSLSTWSTFGDGWSNRVASVRRHAIAMTASLPTAIVSAPDGMASADPADLKITSTTQGKGAIAGVVGIASTAIGSAKDSIQPLTGSVHSIDTIFTVLTAGGAALAIIGVAFVAWDQMKKVKSGSAA